MGASVAAAACAACIELDRDDGVRGNYLELGEALALISRMAAKGKE